MTCTRLVPFALLAFLLLVSTAVAQTPEQREEARARFDRGIQLFSEGHDEAALAEFEEAYRLAPAYQVLFNIGKAHGALGHAVEAVDALERYLSQGGQRIAPERRTEVETELARQRARIGFINVQCNIDSATVAIDGNDVANTPLPSAIRVSVGSHTVSVRAPGHETAQRVVVVAGGVTIPLDFQLRPILEARGALRISTSIVGVEVRVDDEVIGVSPLDATVAVDAGRRAVVGRRRGYRDARVLVDVPTGLEVEVRLVMERDPDAGLNDVGTLRLVLPEEPFQIRVDGEEFRPNGDVLELPIGPHDVNVEVQDRRPHRSQVLISAEQATNYAPELRWTDAARAERVGNAQTRRGWGWATLIAGTLIAGGSAGLYVWDVDALESNETELAAAVALADDCRTIDCDEAREGVQDYMQIQSEVNDLASDNDLYSGLKWVSISAMILGGVSAITGVVLFTTSESESSIDADASGDIAVSPIVGPGELGLHVRF